MNIKNLFFSSVLFIIAIFLILNLRSNVSEKKEKESICLTSVNIDKNAPPCLQMYDAIVKYADQYDIPRKYAFGVAWVETRYGGPFDWKYNHMQISSAGAIGPMQIMPSTGRSYWSDEEYSNTRLKADIDFNVHTSMKVLRKLYDKYKDWKTVFGCYNTGRPCINEYANRVYNFMPKWNY